MVIFKLIVDNFDISFKSEIPLLMKLELMELLLILKN